MDVLASLLSASLPTSPFRCLLTSDQAPACNSYFTLQDLEFRILKYTFHKRMDCSRKGNISTEVLRSDQSQRTQDLLPDANAVKPARAGDPFHASESPSCAAAVTRNEKPTAPSAWKAWPRVEHRKSGWPQCSLPLSRGFDLRDTPPLLWSSPARM